jgi:hypothetical protein
LQSGVGWRLGSQPTGVKIAKLMGKREGIGDYFKVLGKGAYLPFGQPIT